MFSHHCERGLHVTHSQQLASILSTPLEYQFRMWSPWHRNWIFLESMSRGADQPSRFPPLPCRFSNMQHVADTHHRLMIGFDMFNKLQFNLTENQKTLAGSRWFKACRMSFLFQSRIWPRYRKKSPGDQKKDGKKSEMQKLASRWDWKRKVHWKTIEVRRALKDFKDIWDELNHRGLNQSDSMIIESFFDDLLVGQQIHLFWLPWSNPKTFGWFLFKTQVRGLIRWNVIFKYFLVKQILVNT